MTKRQKITYSYVYLIPIVILTMILAVSVQAAEKGRYPHKPVTLIVTYSAGSGADTDVRLIQPYFQKHLGTRVVVSNIPGADGRLGLTKAFKAPPDGYTIFSTGWAPGPIISEILFKPEYKSLEYTHIGAWSVTNFVLVVNSETWKTMEEFVQAAKTRKLSCGISGMASASRIIGEALLDATGIKEMSWVSYAGGSESMTQLAGKHIDLVITSTSSALPLVRAGRIRPLTVFADQQDSVFPSAPLAKQLGYNVQPLPSARALLGPPKMDTKIIKTIEEAMVKAAQEPEFQAKMKDRGAGVQLIGREQLKKDATDAFAAIQKYISRMGGQQKLGG